MNIENLPTLRNIDLGLVEDPRRPVLSFNWQAPGPHRAGGHSHPRAQIIYQCAGVYRVTTARGSFVVPPQQAIWIPSHVYHETFTNDAAHALMLFIDHSFAQSLPADCMVVSVSPLLAQLFIRAVNYGNEYLGDDRAARLVQVMLDELQGLQPAPLRLPLASDPRLRRAMEQILAEPTRESSVAKLAGNCGASARTLARLFRQQTGMTYLEWRNRLRLLEAIDRLNRGHAVTRVAGDLGYHSASAFIAMFRRNLGLSPARYMEQQSQSAAVTALPAPLALLESR